MSDSQENGQHSDPASNDVFTEHTEDSFDVDIQPDVSALRMFRSMSFTPWFALGEFVDNAITSALKNRSALTRVNGTDYQLRIQIDFPEGADELIIKDNAAGISRQEMHRALRTGKPPQDTAIGLSRHGVGMKAAAFWWGGRLEIKTYPLGEINGWHTVVDVSDNSDIAELVKVRQIPSRGFPGTEIRVCNLWQKTPTGRTKGAIRAYLPSIYRAFLGGGSGAAEIKCNLEYEGTLLQYENPSLLDAPFWPSREGPEEGAPSVTWRQGFETTLSTGKSVSGWYGILSTMNRDRSGFFLHYRGKGIAGVVPVQPESSSGRGHEAEGAKDAIARSSYKPRKIFGATGLYRDQSFVGEFDISDFGKTISTDSPLWSPEEEAEFVDDLYEHMVGKAPSRNFIKMAENYRRRPAREVSVEIGERTVRETERVERALSNRIEHVDVNGTAPKEYGPPPSVVSEENTSPNQAEPDLQTFPIKDREGHEHIFRIEFVSDRSADFIGLFESGEGMAHTVRVNRAHPVLDDIPDDVQMRLLLTRIAVSLACAEVFLTMFHKERVREQMNDYLLRIGSPTIDE